MNMKIIVDILTYYMMKPCACYYTIIFDNLRSTFVHYFVCYLIHCISFVGYYSEQKRRIAG